MKSINKSRKVASAIYTTICALSTCTEPDQGYGAQFIRETRKTILDLSEGPMYSVTPIVLGGRLYIIRMEIVWNLTVAYAKNAADIEIIPVTDPSLEFVYRIHLGSCRLEYQSGGVWIEHCVGFELSIKRKELDAWLDVSRNAFAYTNV